MAARQGWLRQASARVTRLVIATGEAIAEAVRFASSYGVALAHWLKRRSTGAIRSGNSALDALRHLLRISTDNDDDDVNIVLAETEVENLGTEEDPIVLPKIKNNHDFVVFQLCVEQ